MTSQKKFGWTGFLILVSVLLTGVCYKRLTVANASSLTGEAGTSVTSRVGASRLTAPMDANDLLVLRFDNSLNGENGEVPTQASGTSFQTGVSNQGVLLPNPNQLFYSSADNINATEGSFECWLKPTWNGNDGLHHFVLQYGVGGGIIIGKDGANNMRIILNRFGVAPGGEVGVAFNVGTWAANQWHHIAFTWSNSAKQLAVYSDGTLRAQTGFAINLPAISNTTLQIGGDGAGSYIQAVVDELRISDRVRTAQEISNRMLAGLTVSSWSLNPATSAVELWPTWYWWITPTITASTNVGTLSLPVLAASWSSSNPAVAILEASSGRFKALAPGSAVQTGTLGSAQNSFTINVVAPVLPPVEETVDPFLATPASSYLHRMPVVIIRYFPTRDGVNLDPVATGTTSTLAGLKSTVEQIERQHKFMLEEGSRFRGYGNAAAPPALGYQIIKTITVYEEVPPGFDAGGGAYFPDYNQILSRFGGENFVNNLGVKEFWIVQQHHGRVGINESNMSSPTTGDISNSFRTNGDQPIYNKTYVTYGINFTRSQAEATHNHGHQLESILSHVNQLRDGNTTLWWQQFARAANNPPARCGNTHFPPNALVDYDYTNLNLVASDILNWQPAGGPTTMVNANTWGNVPYAWPGGTAPSQEVESKWYIFWFQSMAGRGNAIPYNSNRLTNWWQFTADWDAAIQGGLGLHEPGSCSYTLSATSQQVPLGGGTFTVNVTGDTGCKWIASSNETWAGISGGSFGNGNGSVTFTVAPAGAPRTGTLAVANQLFTINQSGGGCPTITLSPATLPNGVVGTAYSQTISASGGAASYSFALVSGALPTGVTLSSSGALTGPPGATGTFNFTVRATDANACFGDQAYSLFIAPACSFTLNPTSANLPAASGGGIVNVTTQTGCAWTATDNATWITMVNSSGTGSGAATYTVTANSGATRTGMITVNGQIFTVTQDPPFPVTSDFSDQKAGSILVFPYYTSSAASPQATNTRISITNTNQQSGVSLKLFSIQGSGAGTVMDYELCLTANQTATFLTSDIDPGLTGYLVAVAVDSTGLPINFNFMAGEGAVKLASGHRASLKAEAIAAVAANPASAAGGTAALNFDGISYNRLPRALAIEKIGSPADQNNTLLILTRITGNYATSVVNSIGLVNGNLYNDAVTAASFSFTAATPQFVQTLSNTFPATTPPLGTIIPAGRTGWLYLATNSDVGLFGATLNLNSNAGTLSSAFNGGGNLRALTLSGSNSIVIPVTAFIGC
ncbi:MAG: LamG-like jellyroll fold domain-containing protein [Acidobacteriota bacterium]